MKHSWTIRRPALAFCSVAALLSSCTKPNPRYCDSDTDCSGNTPFCDVEGEFAESDYSDHFCIAQPASCPISRCGCTPAATLSCTDDMLAVCGADGRSSSTSACALGCADATRCFGFEPSNGLGPALEQARQEVDVMIPSGARIDTDLGSVTGPTGAIAVSTQLLMPATGPKVRVLIARTFVFDDVVVTGSAALAVVASGSIALRGRFDASANGALSGPGALDLPAMCAGPDTQEFVDVGFDQIAGPGGGGNATVGGAGGGRTGPSGAGGTALVGFEPLMGGCRGGSSRDTGGTVRARGGGGGGAVQFVSDTSIVFTQLGLLDIGGGGGAGIGADASKYSGGGGSGGLTILEAPVVSFSGTTTGITANGAAAGGCQTTGPDGRPDAIAAQGPQCSGSSAGTGGTSASAPTGVLLGCPGTCSPNFEHYDGGGGAAGRARIATETGAITQSGMPTLSVVVTSAILATR